MRKGHHYSALIAIAPLLVLSSFHSAFSWGREGHETINLGAWEIIAHETDLPAFFKKPSTKDSLVYLSNEPDRWKDPLEPTLKAGQDPEHYFDFEPIRDTEIPPNRYIAIELYRSRGIKPEDVGFLPYAIMETYEKLKASFREFRKSERSPSELERVTIHYAGILGHYVGDGSQPLHVTVHHHGWMGQNPFGFTQDRSIHRQFENDFVRLHINPREVTAKVERGRVLLDVFQEIGHYLQLSNAFVRPLYEIEKKSGFVVPTSESKRFVVERMAAGSQMLATLWKTAWVKSGE